MRKMAGLEYIYLFDDSTFGNLYDFENFMGQAFKAKGYEANVIDMVKGFSGRRIVYITRMKDMLEDSKQTYRGKQQVIKSTPIKI